MRRQFAIIIRLGLGNSFELSLLDPDELQVLT